MKSGKKEFLQMDSGIKLLIFLVLGIVPFFISCYVNFLLLLTYLLIATVLTRIQLRVIIKNILAYIVIIIFPYVFGLLMATGIAGLTGSNLAPSIGSPEEISLRLFKLFILWYVGILYFNSTKIESVLGLFDKLLSPFKRIGVPVSDFLKVIMCVINELRELAPEVKKSFSDKVSGMFGKRKEPSKSNIKGISQIISSFIVDSFQRLGRVEEYIEQVENEDLFGYEPVIAKKDVFGLISVLLLLGTMVIFSNTICIS